MSKVTLVTGLWNLGRENLGDFGRSFDHYLENFGRLLSLDMPMIVWVPKELNRFVMLNRSMSNTKIINKELSEFDTWFPWFYDVQQIRQREDWLAQADWLRESPQAKLEYYNPVVMSKFFMLNDSTVHDSFNSDYLFWIDGGLTNTVPVESLQNTDRLDSYMKSLTDKDFVFLSYPYETEGEVHGYPAKAFSNQCGVDKSTYVCRGGFFGGSKQAINQLNGEYYAIAANCFREKNMGTEECFHTIMSYKFKNRCHRFELSDNGLVYPFFEHLGTLESAKPKTIINSSLIPWDKRKSVEDIKTSLYVLTYNSPEQFAKVAQTWLDNGFDKCHRRILIDNSTDTSTYAAYQELCNWFYFEHIKKEENLGVCGGRQAVAEHFNESDSEYYVFIEDDMHLNYPTNEVDSFGFPRYVDNLYEKSLSIVHQNHYDFLKLTYCEFFGNNATAWAWYNVPQDIREMYWPDYNKLPEEGLDPNAPKVEPKARKRYKSLNYLEGDYHYCNWPIWVSREGNRKIFLDTKWARPFEQTWMSNVFQLQQFDKIKSGVLEASPITHDRFEFYPAEERKES